MVQVKLAGRGKRPTVEYSKVDIAADVTPDEAMHAMVDGLLHVMSGTALYKVRPAGFLYSHAHTPQRSDLSRPGAKTRDLAVKTRDEKIGSKIGSTGTAED